MKLTIAASCVALAMTAGSAHYAPAAAQADQSALRKSCVQQVRKSQGLQKGQQLRGAGKAIDACIANGGKL